MTRSSDGGPAEYVNISTVAAPAPSPAPAPAARATSTRTVTSRAPARSSGGGGGGSVAASAPASDPSSVAASFGYSLAFFNSDPELKALLDRATSQNYTSARFVAELQNTGWFRRNGEAGRKYLALQTTDPATLSQMIDTAQATIWAQASDLGAQLTTEDARALADMSIRVGWNADQIKSALADRLAYDATVGFKSGRAAALQAQFKATLADYGVNVSDQTLGQWVRDSIRGSATQDTVKAYAIQQAISRYPGLADRINAGETVRQIADPYVQSQSRILELNPDTIGLDDQLIQRALSSTGADGKPTVKTLWEFENDLRNDPRWVKTKNAQDSLMASAKTVLGDLGLAT